MVNPETLTLYTIETTQPGEDRPAVATLASTPRTTTLLYASILWQSGRFSSVSVSSCTFPHVLSTPVWVNGTEVAP